MGPYYYWLSSDARFQEIQRGHNEARVAGMADALARVAEVTVPLVTRLAAPLAAPLAAGGSAIRRWYRRAATMRQLNALDDRLLNDIGLTRAGIREAAQWPERFAVPGVAAPAADIHTLPRRREPSAAPVWITGPLHRKRHAA